MTLGALPGRYEWLSIFLVFHLWQVSGHLLRAHRSIDAGSGYLLISGTGIRRDSRKLQYPSLPTII